MKILELKHMQTLMDVKLSMINAICSHCKHSLSEDTCCKSYCLIAGYFSSRIEEDMTHFLKGMYEPFKSKEECK